ncbi:MAG: peptidoglycan recognition family protein [Candidatus Theseobacter exili]|nr:peptidoglycan recognition family protein [Candidatus Theseobacter exili]
MRLFFSLLFIFSTSLSSCYASSIYPKNKRWKYIVIHHSGTEVGNAKAFDRNHRARGMENGLAYHFVINNGSSGTKDGEIEIGERWKKQLHGGHCKQESINQCGIGICLVGNFEKNQVSKKQLDSLVWLVKKLMRSYNIPAYRVKGHGNMKGEHTRCPGKTFPFKTLYRSLKK